MMYREQQQLQALRNAREVLRTLAGNAGEDAFWNEGGKGYQTVEELDAALAVASHESISEQMPSPRLIILLQTSLETACQALDVLVARNPKAGPGVDAVLDAQVAESLNQLGLLGSQYAENVPGFQVLLAILLRSLGGY